MELQAALALGLVVLAVVGLYLRTRPRAMHLHLPDLSDLPKGWVIHRFTNQLGEFGYDAWKYGSGYPSFITEDFVRDSYWMFSEIPDPEPFEWAAIRRAISADQYLRDQEIRTLAGEWQLVDRSDQTQ